MNWGLTVWASLACGVLAGAYWPKFLETVNAYRYRRTYEIKAIAPHKNMQDAFDVYQESSTKLITSFRPSYFDRFYRLEDFGETHFKPVQIYREAYRKNYTVEVRKI